MSKIVESHEPGSSEVNHLGKVWPPEIEYQFASESVVLTKRQQQSVHYRWYHMLAALYMPFIGVREYFSAPYSWEPALLHKIVIPGVCLLIFIGNLLRAFQGWRLKALADRIGQSQK